MLVVVRWEMGIYKNVEWNDSIGDWKSSQFERVMAWYVFHFLFWNRSSFFFVGTVKMNLTLLYYLDSDTYVNSQESSHTHTIDRSNCLFCI